MKSLFNLGKIVFACTSIILISCNLDRKYENLEIQSITIDSQNAKKDISNWTLMVYIAGDNDLEEYVVKDIENELANTGSTKNVQITVLADRIKGYDQSRGDWQTTKLFHVTKNLKANSENSIKDLGELNTGDPNTLSTFVKWSKNNYPAKNYALFMWGHGWNWHPEYTMEDKTDKDSLDPHEIKSILKDLGQIDMIAYDGCNMGSIEVEALWAGTAKAIVHSQEYVGWDGIEYDKVIKELNKNPNMDAYKLSVITNQSAGINKEKTGSAIALDFRWNKMINSFNDWIDVLKDGLPKYKSDYSNILSATQSFIDAKDDKDLYDLVDRIYLNIDHPIIKSKSKELMKNLKNITLDEWHINKEYPNAHGITITKLNKNDKYTNYYKKSIFSNITKWDEFLEEYNK